MNELDAQTSATERQSAIWRSRIHREYEKCHQPDSLPEGVTLKDLHIDEDNGICVGAFHCFVPFQHGSDALSIVPLIVLEVSMPYAQQHVAMGQAQYPFLAPEVKVVVGKIYLPSEMLQRLDNDDKRNATAFDEQDTDTTNQCREYFLKIPTLTRWSPSNTLVMILHEFVSMVQQNDPRPAPAKSPSANGTSEPKRMRMRKRDIHGTIYSTQEIDTRTGSLRFMPMLLQGGSIALMVPRRAEDLAKDDPFIYVNELIPLRDITRITPQRGKSVTFFFSNPKLPCRTFLTKQTDGIVADVQRMIAMSSSSGGTKRGRDEAHKGEDSSGNTLAQLLPFLSQEQTEKAKEVSNKLMGKLGKYANSVSRFLRGDDEEEPKPDPLAHVFADINARKEVFFRTPSKQRMTDITRRYQHIAEQYAHRRNTDGLVERAIKELQTFVEHPTTQRILLEACAYERSNSGIRVGPAT